MKTKRACRLPVVLGAILFLTLAGSAGAADEIYPGETWDKTTDPEGLGWSAAKLARARAFSQTIGSAAVMIVDDGVVVAEWGEVAKPYKLHSIRKPIMGALIGIQVDMGAINLSATLDDLGIDDNPPSLSVVEKTATVGHLMQARSGVYHPALGEADSMKTARPERFSHVPGTFYYYNNWDFNALGTIFERVTGTTVCDAFVRDLAGPLGMEDFAVGDCDYGNGLESVHRQYRFRLSARDLARFGLLYLRGGEWQGKRIVPEGWVTLSTTAHSHLADGRGYGYLWATVDDGTWFPNVTLPGHAFGHSGLGVHFLFVVPERRLVIVHRVDTDRRGRYPANFMLGHLTWLILDAAGETGIGPDPSFERATGTPVTSENAAEFFGRGTLVFEGMRRSVLVEGGDFPFTTHLDPDGSVTIESGGRTADNGTWWLDGPRFGFKLDRMTRGRAETRFAVADGGRVNFYDPATGSLAFTLTRVGD